MNIEFITQQSEDAWNYYLDELDSITDLDQLASLNMWLYKRLSDILSDSLELQEDFE